MKLTFTYNRDRDIWCILNYSKTSTNSPTPTKAYTDLTNQYGKHVSKIETNTFIESYITKNQIDITEIIQTFQNSWDGISAEYQKRAENIFGVVLPRDITVYLTINNRCPYSIEDDMFYVSTTNKNTANKTAMHELWHFYTWFKYGIEWQEKLGAQKYNEIKESLTVLLNVECKDLLPEDITDNGYPQHQELREKILSIWSQDKNIDRLWHAFVVTR